MYLLKHGRTWNDQERPTTSKKRSETNYNEQETTWNDLQQARNDLKRQTMWNNLEQARNDLKRPTVSKKQLETTYNKQEMTCKEQILTSGNSSTWKTINWRAPMSQRSKRSITCWQYFKSSVDMWNDDRQKNQSKCQNQTKQSKKTLNNHLVS